MNIGYALLAVWGVSIVSLIGIIALGFPLSKLKKVLVCFFAFSVGILLWDAFLHLLPEAVEEYGLSLKVSFAILWGILGGFIIEKLFHLTHHHTKEQEKKKSEKSDENKGMEFVEGHFGETEIKPFAFMNLLGDFIHNIIDGIIIGVAFMVDVPLGISTTLAVILHELPQEIGDFCVLIQGGFPKKKALCLNFLTALSAFIGLGIVYLLESSVEGISEILLPFSAGLFIYIAVADMLPEMHKECSFRQSVIQIFLLLIGLWVMLGLALNEEEHHEEEHEHHQIIEHSEEPLIIQENE